MASINPPRRRALQARLVQHPYQNQHLAHLGQKQHLQPQQNQQHLPAHLILPQQHLPQPHPHRPPRSQLGMCRGSMKDVMMTTLPVS